MQRSLPYQDALTRILFVGLYLVYISLSSMYLLMPPLLAILFFGFYKALNRYDLAALVPMVVMLLVFEAEKGFWFGSTVLFFSIVVRYFLPKIEQIVQCRLCMAAIFVGFAYPGYWIFVWSFNNIMMIPLPTLDWHILLYMVIEFLILAALV